MKNRHTSKLWGLVALVLVIAALAGCAGSGGSSSSSSSSSATQSQTQSQSQSSSSSGDPAQSNTALLIADFSCGTVMFQDELVKPYEFEYVGDLTPELIAEGLSTLTGLDFFVEFQVYDNHIVVEWLPNSTLIANLDDREQEPDFFFYDVDSLRWFMMDSMRQTLMTNFGVEEIYYSTNGGQDIIFDALYPTRVIPSGIPYEGSPFFYAHADVRGDMDPLELVEAALGDEFAPGTVIYPTGTEEVDGETCIAFAFGKDDPNQFDAYYFFAVTPDGELLVKSPDGGDYEPFFW